MERRDPSISENYSPVILHLDDFTEIVEILNGGGKSPEISTEEYRFTSIDEVCQKHQSGRLTSLSIKSTSPYLTLDLYRSSCRLYVGSSRPEAAGLFWKIDSVLRRCQRPAAWVYSWPGSLGIGILFGLSLNPAFKLHLAVGLALIALWGAWNLWFLRVQLRYHSLVILEPRAGTGIRGFINRNKDQLLLALISALLGLILGIIGTLFGTHVGR